MASRTTYSIEDDENDDFQAKLLPVCGEAVGNVVSSATIEQRCPSDFLPVTLLGNFLTVRGISLTVRHFERQMPGRDFEFERAGVIEVRIF